MNKIVEWLFLLAINLGNSAEYQRIKQVIFEVLEGGSRAKKYVDSLLIAAVVISTALYLYDIKHEASLPLQLVEYFITAIFVLEYILRFWVATDGYKSVLQYFAHKNETGGKADLASVLYMSLRSKMVYVIRLLSIIDLISIFPAFRILRIFKLFRYSDGVRNFFSVFQEKRHEVGILAVLIGIAIFMSSALFYIFEYKNAKIATYFDAVYWSVITIATVGYGDITPETINGKMLTIVLVFSGLGVIAMLTSLVTTGLTQKISEIKEKQNKEETQKLSHCTVVVGFGLMGQDLAERLKSKKLPFFIIDKNKEKANLALSMGYNAFALDAAKPTVLKELEVDKKATSVVCVTDNDIVNISISLAVRAIGSKAHIIARVEEARNEDKMRLAGVNTVISDSIGASLLLQALNRPIIYKTVTSLMYQMDGIGIEQVAVDIGESRYPLQELNLDGMGCTPIGVFQSSQDGKFLFNPKQSEYSLVSKDVLILLGKPARIQSIRETLSKRARR